MKKSFVFMLGLAVLASCSQDDAANNESQTDKPVKIELGAGVNTLTRAVIEQDSKFTAGVAGWESKETADYSNAYKWYTTTSEISASASNTSIKLTTPQYYNADNSIKTYMKAWYPAGEVKEGKVTFTNTDGSVDAMLATAINGSKNDATGKNFTFKHMTTQLKFEVKAGEGLANDTKIKSIKVKGVTLPTGFDLTTDAVTWDTATKDLSAGVKEAVITSEAKAAGTPVMIKPFTGKTVKLDIETSNATFTDVTATIDGNSNFEAGKAYTITLTFKQKSVALSATVTAWNTGTGTGDVE